MKGRGRCIEKGRKAMGTKLPFIESRFQYITLVPLVVQSILLLDLRMFVPAI